MALSHLMLIFRWKFLGFIFDRAIVIVTIWPFQISAIEQIQSLQSTYRPNPLPEWMRQGEVGLVAVTSFLPRRKKASRLAYLASPASRVLRLTSSLKTHRGDSARKGRSRKIERIILHSMIIRVVVKFYFIFRGIYGRVSFVTLLDPPPIQYWSIFSNGEENKNFSCKFRVSLVNSAQYEVKTFSPAKTFLITLQ
jgi:hypothetical protein